MQREISLLPRVFVSVLVPSQPPAQFHSVLTQEQQAQIKLVFYNFCENGQLWRGQKLCNCCDWGVEWNNSLDIISENVHEIKAAGKDLIHTHTFRKLNVTLRIFGNKVLLVWGSISDGSKIFVWCYRKIGFCLFVCLWFYFILLSPKGEQKIIWFKQSFKTKMFHLLLSFVFLILS